MLALRVSGGKSWDFRGEGARASKVNQREGDGLKKSSARSLNWERYHQSPYFGPLIGNTQCCPTVVPLGNTQRRPLLTKFKLVCIKTRIQNWCKKSKIV